ncbi:MAG: ABC transporter ATP-binding protein [Desulfarculus sp.]|nr:ABC transporter ATP-binding protein [Desulfarculus sp.]
MLEVKGMDVYYGDLQALRGVSLTVGEGEVVSVIGSNGMGKSTTLKAISGLLHPRRGSIHYLGRDITRLSPSAIVELGISHVPEGRQVFPSLTVLENLQMGAQFPEPIRRGAQTMEQVFDYFPRLKERLEQKAGTLSGGEQQMLAIGRGLMSLPKLMMLDEPSLGLSPLLVETIFEIIHKISQQGTSLQIIEQNVHHALCISHRGYVLEDGAVALLGPSQELLSDPHVCKAYLGL